MSSFARVSISQGSLRKHIWGARVGHAMVLLVMTTLLVAGMAKAWDCTAFQGSMATWTLLPGWSHPLLALGIPMVEIGIGALWLAGMARPGAQWSAGVLLVAFIGLVGAQILVGHPPECRCFGVLLAYRTGRAAAEQLLLRNIALLTLLVGGSFMKARCAAPPALPRGEGGRRGFALTELLVAISVIVLLISLVMPSFEHFRAAARDSASLSNLRQHTMVFDAYSNDAKDYFPSFVEPRIGSFGIIRYREMVYKVGYLSQTEIWNGLLAPRYYGGRANHPSFFAPDDLPSIDREDEDQGLWKSSYYYSTTCLTDPRYWRARTRTGPDQWRVQMRSAVSFPSVKGLLLQMTPSVYRQGQYWYRASFMDGHAVSRPTGDYFPAEIGDVEFMSAPSAWPVLHTKDGVWGRDLRD